MALDNDAHYAETLAAKHHEDEYERGAKEVGRNEESTKLPRPALSIRLNSCNLSQLHKYTGEHSNERKEELLRERERPLFRSRSSSPSSSSAASSAPSQTPLKLIRAPHAEARELSSCSSLRRSPCLEPCSLLAACSLIERLACCTGAGRPGATWMSVQQPCWPAGQPVRCSQGRSRPLAHPMSTPSTAALPPSVRPRLLIGSRLNSAMQSWRTAAFRKVVLARFSCPLVPPSPLSLSSPSVRGPPRTQAS